MNDEKNKKQERKKRIIKILIFLITICIIILLLLKSCTTKKEEGKEIKNHKEKVNTIHSLSDDALPHDVQDAIKIGKSGSIEFYDNIEEIRSSSFTITFLNEDGSILQEITLNKGEMPSYNESISPLPEQFIGWDNDLSIVNGNATYKAIIHHHNYSKTTIEPTCLEKGYTHYICHECGDEYISDYIDALGHDYDSITYEPTCTQEGSTRHTCARCKDRYYDDYVPALGHDYQYDRDESVDEGNGKTSVYKVYKCSVCGDEYQDYWYTTFSYVSAVQEYNVIKDGIYQVEAWGAGSGSGEKGGYISGEVELHEGDTLYVAVGGQGGKGINYIGVANAPGGAGGWNGGGQGGNGGYRNGHKGSGAGGGGATSIALAEEGATDEEKEKLNKTLAQVGKEEFDKNGLIVAGGAGGANYDTGRNSGMAGGNTNPGTSSFGQGNNGRNGRNKANYGWGGGGGGGGYYGGYSSTGEKSQPRGGSSWTNEDMIDEATVVAQSGVKSENGQAQITFLEDLPEETPAETPEVLAETPAETPESTEA